MRRLKENVDGSFRVKAYAGASGVLLGFDLDESRREGLLGFAIEEKNDAHDWRWLLSSLTFEGRQHTLRKFKATPSNLAPIQKFRWADYTVEPGQTCHYRVYPVYGSPADPQLGERLQLKVTADDGKPKRHRVLFNRAVAASQAFGRNFPELDAMLRENPKLSIDKWPDEPRAWLENGLLQGILEFIAEAEGPGWALDVAIYEYELGEIVRAIDAAHKRGVDVRVLYHAKTKDEQTEENMHSLRRIPKSRKRGRRTSKIFHHKFVVLSRLNADGERVPKRVLCGSTNFTENGVYRQANVVHLCAEPAIAADYLDLFEMIWEAPEDVAASRAWIDEHNPIRDDRMVFAGFSPRSGQVDLDEFVAVIGQAKRDLLFATAFQLPERILDALLGKAGGDVLRDGVQNTSSRITGYHTDRSADFVAPAFLKNGLEGWIKEGLRGQRGRLLIHTKAVVVDFTSDAPSIISGSHNLSVPASSTNDENYLVIRGSTDLADRYGVEILRFYDHYRFRYYAKLLQLKQAQPLAGDDRWTRPYFKKGHQKMLSRLRFSGREP